MKRIYVSGPMTGIESFNFPAFNAEAARLRALGYEVVNPVEINGDTTMRWEECLKRDIVAMMDCDTLALLPGWMNSRGAQLEQYLAHRLGMKIVMACEVTA